MKELPAIVASRDGSRAIEVLEFEGVDRIANRDAVGYYFTIRRAPDAEPSRVAVVFSGTIFAVKPSAFGLPELNEREATFVQFAMARLGDFLDEVGLPEDTPSGVAAYKVECFSPHFQSWADRLHARDDVIQQYLEAHLLWSWKFDHSDVTLGMPDALRLRRPVARFGKLIRLHEDELWNTKEESANQIILTPTSTFLRGAMAAEDDDRATEPAESASSAPDESDLEQAMEPPAYVYVDEVRIADLRSLGDTAFDLVKLIALCEELNLCYRSQCYHAVAALTRAVMDHVPPLLGCGSFSEVANNYSGTRSFKECMQRLDQAARKIADGHLHTQVRASEVLPTRTQVNFANEVDLLLGEVVRLMRPAGGSSDA